MNFIQEEFNKFIEENNVYGFFDEAITLKSGRKSHFYVNWRNITGDVFLTDRLADFIIAFAKDNKLDVDTFYGVPDGATKIGIIAQYKLAKQKENYSKGSHALAMGRAKPKEHGDVKDKYFVGMPKGKVVVLEDVTTTGESLIKTIDSLTESKINIIGVISLTNRMEKRDDGKNVEELIEEKHGFYSMSSALELLPLMYNKLQPGISIGKKIESEFKMYGVEPVKLVIQKFL